jgi:hypothetical protein
LLTTAKLARLDPQIYLTDVLERIVSGEQTATSRTSSLLGTGSRRRGADGRMSSRRRTPSASMAKAAMPLDELDQWLRRRTDRRPDRFEPIYRRKPNRDIDARPWCRGFYAAPQLRMSAWEPLLNTDDINHDLLPRIFVHRVDDQGRPPLGPTRKGPEGEAFPHKASKGMRDSASLEVTEDRGKGAPAGQLGCVGSVCGEVSCLAGRRCRLNGEAFEWNHLLGSARTERVASRFCPRTEDSSSAEGGAKAQEMDAKTS